MKPSTKTTIKSVCVLTAIALICVAVLSAANVFLKKEVVLDKETVAILNENSPTGVENDVAYSQNYFAMLTDTELKNATSYVIKDLKNSSSNAVNAIYVALKGDKAGRYYIETTANGQNPMTVITEFKVESNDYSIENVFAKKQIEDSGSFKQVFDKERFDLYVAEIKGGKSALTDAEIKTVTGATTKNSIRGLKSAVALAIETMNKIYTFDDKIDDELELRGGDND